MFVVWLLLDVAGSEDDPPDRGSDSPLLMIANLTTAIFASRDAS